MGRILIVEDERNIRNGLVRMVRNIDEALEIYETGAAGEALNIAKENVISAFILDIKLEDYSGLELAKQLRELEKYKLTPIIFISGVGSKELDTYRQTHCYAFIEKPFKEEDLRHAFETIINYGNETEITIPKLKLKHQNITYTIKENDVLYIERKNRKLYIKTKKETIINSSSLKSMQKQVSNSFIQCHQGYIINKDFIQKINRVDRIVYLEGINQAMPIGKKFRKNL